MPPRQTAAQLELFDDQPAPAPHRTQELRIRRWRGAYSDGSPLGRYYLTAADERPLGRVDESTGWLILHREGERARVRRLLEQEAPQIVVAGPSADKLERMPMRLNLHVEMTGPGLLTVQMFHGPDAELLPEQDEVEGLTERDAAYSSTLDGVRYHVATGRVVVEELAVLHVPTGQLVLAYAGWRAQVLLLLRRLGALRDGDEPSTPEPGNPRLDRVKAWRPGLKVPSRAVAAADAWRVQYTENRRDLDAKTAARRATRPVCSLGPQARDLLPPALHALAARAVTDAHADAHDGPAAGGEHDGYALLGQKQHPQWRPWRRGVLTWTSAELKWLDTLAAEYYGHFPTMAAWLAEQEQPELHQRARSFVDRQRYPKQTSYDAAGEAALVTRMLIGHAARQEKELRGGWDSPTLPCPCCGEAFDVRALARDHSTYSAGLMLKLGPPRWCGPCQQRAWWARDDRAPSDDEALAGAWFLAEVLGKPPPHNWYLTPPPAGLPGGDFDRLMLAHLVGPRPWEVSAAVPLIGDEPGPPEAGDGDGGETGWWQFLHRAGLAASVKPTSRGVLCTARDGHLCRSLMEKAVDDYLHDAGIEHELEPVWPFHWQYNASGARRADWRLGDGRYVEAAGLLGDPAYDRKIAEKRLLAQACGIELVVVAHADLTRLHEKIPWRPPVRSAEDGRLPLS